MSANEEKKETRKDGTPSEWDKLIGKLNQSLEKGNGAPEEQISKISAQLRAETKKNIQEATKDVQEASGDIENDKHLKPIMDYIDKRIDTTAAKIREEIKLAVAAYRAIAFFSGIAAIAFLIIEYIVRFG